MKEFFGFGGYAREPEGYFSWQHLLFVSSLMAIMVAAAVLLGLRYRRREWKARNRVLLWAAILIDGFEILKIIVFLCRSDDPLSSISGLLPLYLCSIQLITVPLAALAHGRIKSAALDFVFIFGLLGAVMGTYFAGNNYAAYPVLSIDNVVSGLTHAIAGFASLYVIISGMATLEQTEHSHHDGNPVRFLRGSVDGESDHPLRGSFLQLYVPHARRRYAL